MAIISEINYGDIIIMKLISTTASEEAHYRN